MKDYKIYIEESIVKKAVEKGFEKTGWNKECQQLEYYPTAEELCGWLREEHNIMIDIGSSPLYDYKYRGYVYFNNKIMDSAQVCIGGVFSSVMNDCITQALKMI